MRRELGNRARGKQGDGRALAVSTQTGYSSDAAHENVSLRRECGFAENYFVTSEIGQRERACKQNKCGGG